MGGDEGSGLEGGLGDNSGEAISRVVRRQEGREWKRQGEWDLKVISESIRLRDIKAVKKGKRRAEQVTCYSTSTHMHARARTRACTHARARALLLTWGCPPTRRLWLLCEIVLFATIWK